MKNHQINLMVFRWFTKISENKFLRLKNTIVLAATYFPRAQAQVSSALEGLTTEFGMGSGMTPPLKPPEQWCLLYSIAKFHVRKRN